MPDGAGVPFPARVLLRSRITEEGETAMLYRDEVYFESQPEKELAYAPAWPRTASTACS